MILHGWNHHFGLKVVQDKEMPAASQKALLRAA
jgi:hypothetical protein